ncbi:hypothetical protein M0805_007999 [Coniferiporia weirii]|nr:hypothetical protein M0805_007999 [Coniferiporia weirii]
MSDDFDLFHLSRRPVAPASSSSLSSPVSPVLPSASSSRAQSNIFHSSDRPAGLNLSDVSRSGRPVNPHRQSSYSKRHASFDTPREVPFLAEHPSGLSGRRPSFSRGSSVSTIGGTEHPAGQGPLSKGSNVPLHGAVSQDSEGFQDVRSSRLSSVMRADDAPVSKDPMTYKYGNESSSTPPHARTTEANRDQRNAGFWDSNHLRPHLLSSPSKGKGRDFHVQPDHHQSLPPTPYSPYLLHDHERDGIYSPSPLRPSSTLSLPLPSQTPFFALPSTSSVQQQSNNSLSRVVEQVPSDFEAHIESTARSRVDATLNPTNLSSSSDSAMLQRRVSSPPSNSLSALFESADRHGRLFSRTSIADSVSTVSTTPSLNSSANSSIPAPTPPTVHTPPPPPDEQGHERQVSKEGNRNSAPYEPFLSHAPPPADSYITVETTEAEYRLIVRLPGYRRDCIMLSTRRRRILHIAADSWEAGGGHFERRISFGYDADLTLVRAEFDGEHLRVLVPRKVIPVSWFASSGSD